MKTPSHPLAGLWMTTIAWAIGFVDRLPTHGLTRSAGPDPDAIAFYVQLAPFVSGQEVASNRSLSQAGIDLVEPFLMYGL